MNIDQKINAYINWLEEQNISRSTPDLEEAFEILWESGNFTETCGECGA